MREVLPGSASLCPSCVSLIKQLCSHEVLVQVRVPHVEVNMSSLDESNRVFSPLLMVLVLNLMYLGLVSCPLVLRDPNTVFSLFSLCWILIHVL